MDSDPERSFELLDQWTKTHRNKRMGLIESWLALARLVFSKENSQRKLDPKVPEHWESYRVMALERMETIESQYRSQTLTDPIWIGNEIMGIICTGNTPVIRACEALLRANCPADYAPQEGLPTVREALHAWAHWFDHEYNPEFDRETGAPLRWAGLRVDKTLAEMDARAIESTMTKIQSAPQPTTRRL